MDCATKELNDAFAKLASHEPACQAANDKRTESLATVVPALSMDEKVVDVEVISNAFNRLGTAEIKTPKAELTCNSGLKRVRNIMTEPDDNERCLKRARIAGPEPVVATSDLVELSWEISAGEYWWSRDN
jgi:hypothetical protein